ncbi:hypothetical protein ACFQX6_67560 [Streptosporangium lutulentum]
MEIGDEGFRLSAEVALTLHQLLMSLWRKLFPPTDIMIDPKEDRVLHVEVDRAAWSWTCTLAESRARV